MPRRSSWEFSNPASSPTKHNINASSAAVAVCLVAATLHDAAIFFPESKDSTAAALNL